MLHIFVTIVSLPHFEGSLQKMSVYQMKQHLQNLLLCFHFFTTQ